MIETSSQAVEEINTMLFDAWQEDSLTSPLGVVWGNVAHDIKGTPDYFNNPVPFLHVQILHSTGRQASLRGSRGAKFEKAGTLVATYRFSEGGGGNAEALDVLDVVESAFAGKRSPNGVWFRNPSTSDIGTDNTWYVMTFTVNFLYDLIR